MGLVQVLSSELLPSRSNLMTGKVAPVGTNLKAGQGRWLSLASCCPIISCMSWCMVLPRWPPFNHCFSDGKGTQCFLITCSSHCLHPCPSICTLLAPSWHLLLSSSPCLVTQSKWLFSPSVAQHPMVICWSALVTHIAFLCLFLCSMSLSLPFRLLDCLPASVRPCLS